MGFYIMNWLDHTFVCFKTLREADRHIVELVNEGLPKDYISIMPIFMDECVLDIEGFKNLYAQFEC